MTKVVQIEKASPRYKGDVVEDIEIRIHKTVDLDGLADSREVFKQDAQDLFNALRSLPGGTFDQLLILMLQKTASSFIVPHDFHDKELAAPKMLLAIERTLEEIELSRLHNRAPHYDWIEANCRGALEAACPNYIKAEGKESNIG